MSDSEWKCCGCGAPPPFRCKCVTGVAYKIGGGSDWKDNILAALEPAAQPEPGPGELLPCPFCGLAETRVQQNGYTKLPDGSRKPTWWEVACDECDFCHTGHNTREEAIAAWNRRDAREPGTEPTPGQFTTMCLAIEDVVTGRGFDVAIPEEVKAYMRNALMVGGWRGERE